MQNKFDPMSAARMFEHGSLWMMEPACLRGIIAAFRAGKVNAEAVAASPASRPAGARGTVAVIGIEGMMQKTPGWFGVSTQMIQAQLREAAAAQDVDSILLVIDSPGGYVAGTKELADEVRRIDRDVKPVVAYIEDLGASAAYWVASQARMILANDMAEVGSIGVYAVVVDWSKALADAGIAVKVVSSGGLKGAFTEGAPITDEMVADLQGRIEQVAGQFVEHVRQGRKVSAKVAQGWADGRVHLASKAQEIGLIDGVVSSREAAIIATAKAAKQNKTKSRAADAIRKLEAMAAESATGDGKHGASSAQVKQ